MILRVSERRLAWRTLANRDAVDNIATGVVSFAPVSNQSTCVTFKLASSLRRRGLKPNRQISVRFQTP